MSQDNEQSIAEVSSTIAARRVFLVVLAGALAIGSLAASYYADAGLTLSHYDARAHLVVARRVSDSLTPGWRQFGGVWLPLPHLLNVIPVASDWAYRTGALAVAWSVLSLAIGWAAVARFLTLRTGSAAAGIGAAAIGASNPNILYLQATPMTEPLLFGLSLVALALVDHWIQAPTAARARSAAAALAMLVLTRYEGWLVAAFLLAFAFVLSLLRRKPFASALWQVPAAAAVLFLLVSWASTGAWFVSADFFLPDPNLLKQPGVAFNKITEGFSGGGGAIVGVATLVGAAAALAKMKRAPELGLMFALVTPVALPFAAFYAGHPYRVRYVIPLVVAAAVLTGVAIAAAPRRLRWLAALSLVAAVLWTVRPFDAAAPMIVEAQWETPFRLARERVTQALRERDDGTPVLASMGSLGHYMQEASRAGIPLRRFLHEGNGDLWTEALKAPHRVVRFVLIEERAEGGDELAKRAREDAGFLHRFTKVIEAGGLALYERTN